MKEKINDFFFKMMPIPCKKVQHIKLKMKWNFFRPTLHYFFLSNIVMAHFNFCNYFWRTKRQKQQQQFCVKHLPFEVAIKKSNNWKHSRGSDTFFAWETSITIQENDF